MKRIASLAPLILLALVITGISCGGAEVTPTPSPTLAATEITERCAQVMETVDSFHLQIQQVGGTTPIAMGLQMQEAVVDVVKPDKLKGEIAAISTGLPIRIEFITLGNVTFVTNPLTGQWELFPSEFSAMGIFDAESGLAAILRGMTNQSRLGDGKVSGLICYHIEGNITTDDLGPITRMFTLNYLEGVNVAAEIWCDQEDLLLRQIRLEGQITVDEKPGIIRTITLSDFNESVEIKLPE